jgi:hypothetical protein
VHAAASIHHVNIARLAVFANDRYEQSPLPKATMDTALPNAGAVLVAHSPDRVVVAPNATGKVIAAGGGGCALPRDGECGSRWDDA